MGLNKMENKTQEQGREKHYRSICDKVEALSSEVYQHQRVKGFEDYLSGLLDIRREYIVNFHEMDNGERENASLLLEMVKEQIHERLDVLRVKAIQGEVRKK
jgi:hypothetical protein